MAQATLDGKNVLNPTELYREFETILKSEKLKAGLNVPLSANFLKNLPAAELVSPRIAEQFQGMNNTRERFFESTFDVIRATARRNIIIAAIINVRCQQVKEFAEYSDDEDKPGWKIKLVEGEDKPKSGDKEIMKEIAAFIRETGRRDFDGEEWREDDIVDVFEKLTREQHEIDQVAIECRYDRRGELLDYWLLDGATIKRLRETGYRGNNKYAFVQEIEGRVYAVYERKDIVFDYMNKRAGLQTNGYGYSYTEMAIDTITSFLYAMQYNKAQFNHSSMPRGILSFKNSNMTKTALEELQRQWVALFSGVKGMWKTPILQHEADWKAIAPSNRDLEFNQYIQLLASFICAVYGIDAAELGLRFNQAQNVLSENQGAKIAFSKDRGLKSTLGFISTVMNAVMKKNPKWAKYKFVFNGLEKKDIEAMQKIDGEQIKTYKTLNEKRAEKDLPPLPEGDMPLDPTYFQALNAAKMAEQQNSMGMGGDEGGGEDEDLLDDSEIDGLLDSMKSVPNSRRKKSHIKLTFEL